VERKEVAAAVLRGCIGGGIRRGWRWWLFWVWNAARKQGSVVLA